MSKKARKQPKSIKARTSLAVTPLSQHKKIGKDVIPPLAELKNYPGFAPTDWKTERLPEMLWASMLIAALGREEALERFRSLSKIINDRCHKDESRRTILRNVTLSGIAAWSDEEFENFVDAVVRDDRPIFEAFSLFTELPGIERWLRVVLQGEVSDSVVPLEILKQAVGITLWHQSEAATDCRWMRVLAILLSGSMHIPPELSKEILGYPHHGDQHKVRPFIRSTEGSIDAMNVDRAGSSEWPPHFWQSAFALTKSDHRPFAFKASPLVNVTTIAMTRDLRESLRVHAENTTASSAVDARHEVAFGLVTYALDVVIDILALGNSISILGRMGLRSLTEVLINLAILAKHDEDARWKRFRDFGYGQAKLTYLKMLEVQDLPSFVTLEALEQFSNEDIWHEFREMRIGNWNDSDLRKMSESTGIKEDIYDKFYDWSSAFIHGNWAAIRDAEYDLCLNPLHRLHRVLSKSRTSLPDVASDAVEILNRCLDLLNQLYPSIEVRIRLSSINSSEAAN